jgi:Family of unknown function (DUF6000)
MISTYDATFIEKWIMPFYLNVLGPTNYSTEFLELAKQALEEVQPDIISTLLNERDWRPRLTAGWFAGVKRWEGFTQQIGDLLIASELCYQGQGFCFALARFGSDGAVLRLQQYLDIWLSRPDCCYDQDWALASLQWIDEQRGTGYAMPYLAAGGPWETFVVNKPNWDLSRTKDWLSSMMEISDTKLMAP